MKILVKAKPSLEILLVAHAECPICKSIIEVSFSDCESHPLFEAYQTTENCPACELTTLVLKPEDFKYLESPAKPT